MTSEEYSGKPYKIIDSKREHKIGIVATSLSDFMTKGKNIFVISWIYEFYIFTKSKKLKYIELYWKLYLVLKYYTFV